MAGGLGVLGDLYKMQVYALARYINRNKEIIPINIINKAPSAELRHDQKDSDSLPPYDVLDAILEDYIEESRDAVEIAADRGFDLDLVKRVTRMVDRAEYKRQQAAPGIKISAKACGYGRRFPIAAKYEA